MHWWWWLKLVGFFLFFPFFNEINVVGTLSRVLRPCYCDRDSDGSSMASNCHDGAAFHCHAELAQGMATPTASGGCSLGRWRIKNLRVAKGGDGCAVAEGGTEGAVHPSAIFRRNFLSFDFLCFYFYYFLKNCLNTQKFSQNSREVIKINR